MRQVPRYLHVLLVLALIGHGGTFGVQAGNLHPAAASTLESAVDVSATGTAAAEHDCHGHGPPPALPAETTQSAPCDHGDCAYCFCVSPQPVSMSVVLLPAGTQLEAELRARVTGILRASLPAPLLRPPIA